MKTIALFSVLVAVSAAAVPVNVDSNIDWRVVGGSKAALGQFPFIISLRLGTGFHTCGGSLIGRNWVITAAHCVAGGDPSSYTVVAGTNQLNSGGAHIGVAEIVVHPDWNPSLLTNDVALLRLAAPVEESSFITTIELGCEYIDTVRDCTLIGWGRTSYPGTVPNDLQFLDLLSLPYAECKTRWANINPIVPSEICTLTKAGEGACHGDSGGPLIAQEYGINYLTGLVSWGQPCARGMPDVYTRVSSFCPWIKDKIKN
ncbi:Trypsin domain containing protein [Asbolus verrucosus]|uniref:Trypsin domain containing protein n=1 Tax=Asbolus verrucosus TaxID=1661398 RepID=A0A482WF06_ASBVE|nr:Trypsin domain containing protein [Asbolus verrucosus]